MCIEQCRWWLQIGLKMAEHSKLILCLTEKKGLIIVKLLADGWFLCHPLHDRFLCITASQPERKYAHIYICWFTHKHLQRSRHFFLPLHYWSDSSSHLAHDGALYLENSRYSRSRSQTPGWVWVRDYLTPGHLWCALFREHNNAWSTCDVIFCAWNSLFVSLCIKHSHRSRCRHFLKLIFRKIDHRSLRSVGISSAISK